jgi:hypothetical protein
MHVKYAAASHIGLEYFVAQGLAPARLPMASIVFANNDS